MWLKNPLFKLNSENYITLIMVLAPLMNFLSGINIDIYSPSMPEIAREFSTSIAATKQTISATVLGWTVGAFLFGTLMDSWGRRRILLASLSLYVIACLLTVYCHSIKELTVLRTIQGFAISSISIGCRVLIADTIKGPRYPIAILYTSLAWGTGPIVGPYIGGWMQHYYGWQANFWVLTLTGLFFLILVALFQQETLPKRQPLNPKHITTRFLSVIRHRQFAIGALIAGLIQIQIMLYPTVGPFMVEDVLGQSVLVYGNTALAVGACYLIGTLISRLLLKYLMPKQVCILGYVALVMGLALSWLVTLFFDFNLLTIMAPIMLICISSGMIFANLMGANLRLFPEHAGVAVATLTGCLLFIAAVGTFLISQIHIDHLSQLAWIYTGIIALQMGLFFGGYRSIFNLSNKAFL